MKARLRCWSSKSLGDVSNENWFCTRKRRSFLPDEMSRSNDRENESFQPISVKSPTENPIAFKFRCIFDLQLMTIARFLKASILDLPAGLVIDVGAGEAPWKGWLTSNHIYKGIDIRHSKEFGMSQKNNEITLYDGGVMPFEANNFDGALCVEVLEHVEDPNFLLSEIYRVLKSGGVMLLTVPWSARRHHIPHDYHRFTKERLRMLLLGNGFSDIQIKERGNYYCVIANKLLVASIRNIKRITFFNFFYRAPFIFILGKLCKTPIHPKVIRQYRHETTKPKPI